MKQKNNNEAANKKQAGKAVKGTKGNNNAVKDPADWTTGDEPMTGAQASYINTLATEAQEEVDDELTKAEASKKIEELQQKTGRGLDQ
jgi:hypothetical protein